MAAHVLQEPVPARLETDRLADAPDRRPTPQDEDPPPPPPAPAPRPPAPAPTRPPPGSGTRTGAGRVRSGSKDLPATMVPSHLEPFRTERVAMRTSSPRAWIVATGWPCGRSHVGTSSVSPITRPPGSTT